MELIDRVSTETWDRFDVEKGQVWPEYTIITSNMIKPGEWKVACKQLTEEGDIPHIMATLRGCCGRINPLQNVRNCQLLVEDMDIVGIMVVDDCIVKKSAKII